MTKILLLLTILVFSSTIFGATCTSTSRNNYTTNQVLTSTALNADFNQLVSKANAFDGGCTVSGSLEYDALNTTQFAPVLKGIVQGCRISRSDNTTISISKCLASVNGNFVSTTAATTVAFGCTGCSSETASTTYYVYIQTGSTGTTLTPLILTTAPNADGYDNSNNKVLGVFYNNASSNIDSPVGQWTGTRFTPFSEVFVSNGGGHGSTNTKIRRFPTTGTVRGPDITYSGDSATNGSSFTINTSGVYSIVYCDAHSVAGNTFGISVNSAQLTTNIASITSANRVGYAVTSIASASIGNCLSISTGFTSGDVIRAHTDGTPSGTDDYAVNFRITRVN